MLFQQVGLGICNFCSERGLDRPAEKYGFEQVSFEYSATTTREFFGDGVRQL